MKLGKRIIGVTIVLTILVMCLSGCGVSKEKLLIQIGEHMLKAKSFTVKATMDIDMEGNALGVPVSANVNINMNTDVNLNPFVGHGQGAASFDVLGQSQKVDVELYEEIIDKQLTVFAAVDGSAWQKQTKELDDSNYKLYGVLGLAKLGSLFELEDDTTDIDGEECYVIKGTIDGETLEGIVNLALGSAGQAKELLKSVDWSGRQVPTQLYVSKKGHRLVKMSFDMIGVMDAAMDSALGQFSGMLKCDKCILDIAFGNYNEVEQIVIPSDVKDSAKEG